ncbi:MAG: type II secretion system minor pseudopilin GspK [Gammaproteobacteria bacterium]|tara:strand:- start:1710 stop:2678 length:969 start_codon:yes stop_codon:yes gene_type:complete
MYSKDKGVVLISILLIVLLLSSVAVLFGNKYLLSLKRAQYIEFQTLSLNIFRNIESLAQDKIEKELRFNSKKLTKDNPIINEPIVFNINGAEIIGKISDYGNCFNINSIVSLNDDDYIENKKTSAAFKKILSFNEIDNNIIEEVIDQIIDWIDKDANPRAYGLEDYYYSGPLHSPREYTGMRLMVSIEELKSIPAVKQIDWNIFKNHFCAIPKLNDLSLNINTLDLEDAYLLSSIFSNLTIKDAEYILDNIPKSGFDDLNNFVSSFPDLDLKDVHGNIIFKSNIFELNSEINFNEFVSSSKSIIIYEDNNNGFIISRIYNGI